jgi:5-methyltetrahydrofolate--homocysteine methyltransferase
LRSSLEILRPLLEKQTGKTELRKKMVLGTVAGDIHDIGKSLVEMMFVANGYEVIDIGINIPPEGFIEAIQKHKPDIVGLSALLTTTMPAMAQTVQAIDEAGLRNDGHLKIIVGGAPVTEEFAKEIKADLYGENALEGVEVANKALK